MIRVHLVSHPCILKPLESGLFIRSQSRSLRPDVEEIDHRLDLPPPHTHALNVCVELSHVVAFQLSSGSHAFKVPALDVRECVRVTDLWKSNVPSLRAPLRIVCVPHVSRSPHHFAALPPDGVSNQDHDDSAVVDPPLFDSDGTLI